MSKQRRQPDLDALIAEITVDCHDEDEELMGFENVFDEQGSFPCPGNIVGEDVQVISVATSSGRRELIATCDRRGRRYHVALLDIELRADPTVERLLAAYRYWAAPR